MKRSNGIFGKSGTGKTFLTRLLLIGMLQKGTAANLVFDMHSEYGWEGGSEGGHKVKALKQLFQVKAYFSLHIQRCADIEPFFVFLAEDQLYILLGG
ncbi:hypothetical protein ES703_83136 [subsurface metagenome]